MRSEQEQSKANIFFDQTAVDSRQKRSKGMPDHIKWMNQMEAILGSEIMPS